MNDFSLPVPVNVVKGIDIVLVHGDIHYIHHRWLPDVVVGLVRFCPGCNEQKYVAFHPFANAQEHEWHWNGDRKKPSLMQPISCGCGYRAVLIHGEFT